MEESKAFSRHEYAQREFWNSRFKEYTAPFDWYVSWTELKTLFLGTLPANEYKRTLMVGCGNSRKNYIALSVAMEQAEYDITNIDISDVVIDQAREKNAQDFLIMDATRMAFRDKTFELLVDKGTYDALASDSQSVLAHSLVTEMGRVTEKALVIITHGKPENRSRIFKAQLAGEWREQVVKCELSPQSQFINVIRSKFPGESLKGVIRDPEKLKICIKEMNRSKEDQGTADEGSTRQSICWVYIYFRVT